MARALLAGTSVVYDGDPLRDLTPAAFLDKFIARRPKAGGRARGGSAMQPLPGVAETGAPDFGQLSEADVAPEDVFFLKYYSLAGVARRRAAAAARKARAAGAGEEEEELLSDADSEDADAYLEGEEEGGEEGIGADPDRAAGYDYSQLADAMADSGGEDDSDSESDAGGLEESDGGEESADGEEEVVGGDDEGESGGDDKEDADGSELEGAEFSDMSSGDEDGDSDDDLASLPDSGAQPEQGLWGLEIMSWMRIGGRGAWSAMDLLAGL